MAAPARRAASRRFRHGGEHPRGPRCRASFSTARARSSSLAPIAQGEHPSRACGRARRFAEDRPIHAAVLHPWRQPQGPLELETLHGQRDELLVDRSPAPAPSRTRDGLEVFAWHGAAHGLESCNNVSVASRLRSSSPRASVTRRIRACSASAKSRRSSAPRFTRSCWASSLHCTNTKSRASFSARATFRPTLSARDDLGGGADSAPTGVWCSSTRRQALPKSSPLAVPRRGPPRCAARVSSASTDSGASVLDSAISEAVSGSAHGGEPKLGFRVPSLPTMASFAPRAAYCSSTGVPVRARARSAKSEPRSDDRFLGERCDRSMRQTHGAVQIDPERLAIAFRTTATVCGSPVLGSALPPSPRCLTGARIPRTTLRSSQALRSQSLGGGHDPSSRPARRADSLQVAESPSHPSQPPSRPSACPFGSGVSTPFRDRCGRRRSVPRTEAPYNVAFPRKGSALGQAAQDLLSQHRWRELKSDGPLAMM